MSSLELGKLTKLWDMRDHQLNWHNSHRIVRRSCCRQIWMLRCSVEFVDNMTRVTCLQAKTPHGYHSAHTHRPHVSLAEWSDVTVRCVTKTCQWCRHGDVSCHLATQQPVTSQWRHTASYVITDWWIAVRRDTFVSQHVTWTRTATLATSTVSHTHTLNSSTTCLDCPSRYTLFQTGSVAVVNDCLIFFTFSPLLVNSIFARQNFYRNLLQTITVPRAS